MKSNWNGDDAVETSDALTRVLGGREEIAPSSGFAVSVMEAIQQEAAAPEPISFPWKWALPGLVVCLGLIGALLSGPIHVRDRAVSGAASGLHIGNPLSLLSHGMAGAPIGIGIEWSVAAVLASLAIVWLTMRMVTGRE